MLIDPQLLAEQIKAGKRRALSKAITLVESTRRDHRAAAVELLQLLAPSAGGAIRIGISGVPGVGKSTFIEALGNYVIGKGHRLAVLAVDPSSSLSGGSIMGDKTRMEELSRQVDAFIRPSPAGSTLGGVARRTRETMLLCEAAGFDVIFVETVGVGQSETAVADMTDLFLLLLLPGGGDDLQGIKRGIMELADLILVNKADGELAAAARHSAADYRSALTLIHPRTSGWKVPVKTCSAAEGKGLSEAWDKIEEYRALIGKNGQLAHRRAAQAKSWMWSEISEGLLTTFKQDDRIRSQLSELEQGVTGGLVPPTLAAAKLLDLFLYDQ
ncbi:MAG: methylmalonyl Co-A mutase-associated GTPase MeaB [Chromatiaceae bacterium]|nr:methylmalonyl Co-A mutase-associated GTPase MeaB [Chromatiaceae bacterium]MCP5444688.1 methylmalonyl Co-A mutase-associated GTPase MeaB [Chromatiaceae bacterium]